MYFIRTDTFLQSLRDSISLMSSLTFPSAFVLSVSSIPKTEPSVYIDQNLGPKQRIIDTLKRPSSLY